MKQKGLSDVMYKLSCGLYVFTLHCINSILVILLMSICISVLLVWLSITMFKPTLFLRIITPFSPPHAPLTQLLFSAFYFCHRAITWTCL